GVPSVIGGVDPSRFGFVVPTTEELIGRGGQPFVSSVPSRAQFEASVLSPATVPPGSSRKAYAQIRYSPVLYPNPEAGDIAAVARAYIERRDIGGFSPEKAPEVYATLDRFERSMAARGAPITPSDLDTLRQQLRGLPGASGPAGNHAVTYLDH